LDAGLTIWLCKNIVANAKKGRPDQIWKGKERCFAGADDDD
jgi:hypothetical protein